MIRNNGWINTLLTLVLIAIPALIGFYLMYPEWRANNNFEYYWYWITALCFLFYSVLINYLLIKLKIVAYESIAIMIPFALILSGLFVTVNLGVTNNVNIIIKVVVAFVLLLCAFPLNVLATNLTHKKIKELKTRQKRILKK